MFDSGMRTKISILREIYDLLCIIHSGKKLPKSHTPDSWLKISIIKQIKYVKALSKNKQFWRNMPNKIEYYHTLSGTTYDKTELLIELYKLVSNL